MSRNLSRVEKIERKVAPGEDVAATLRALPDDEFLAVAFGHDAEQFRRSICLWRANNWPAIDEMLDAIKDDEWRATDWATVAELVAGARAEQCR